ncbi:MAG: TetR family transcriptional regulator [Myxococcota bacterium]
MRETGDLPSPEQVAERAGVSRRSVFRHFNDMSALAQEAMTLQRAEVAERFMPLPLPEGDVAERVEALVDNRADIYEFIMPLRRIAERRRHEAPHVERGITDGRKFFRAHVEVLFKDFLPTDRRQRGDVLNALEQISSWSAWRTLRDDQGCSIAQAKRVVNRTLLALLDDP